MVKSLQAAMKTFAFIFVSLAFASLPACQSIWGESKPLSKVFNPDENSGPGCPNLQIILAGSITDAQITIDCLERELSKLWDSVEGREKNRFSDREIKSLVRSGIIRLTGNSDDDLTRIESILTLFDLSDNLSKKAIESWFATVRENLVGMRDFYSLLNNSGKKITYDRLQSAFQGMMGVLKKLRWRLNHDDLIHHIRLAFPSQDRDWDPIVTHLTEFSISFLGAFCWDIESPDRIAPQEVHQCLGRAISHFEVSRSWFEFALNPISESPDVPNILKSLRQLSQASREWFSDSRLKPFRLEPFWSLAEALGAKPPFELLDSLDVIKNLSQRSDGRKIDPIDIPSFFEIYYDYHQTLLPALKLYYDSFSRGECANEATNWKECIPTHYASWINSRPEMQFMRLIQDPLTGGLLATPPNGRRLVTVHLFRALANWLIKHFDHDQDGFISFETQEGEAQQLVGVLTSSAEVIGSMISNIDKKINGLPLERYKPNDSFTSLDRDGLSQLVTLVGAEALVNRTRSERKNLLGFFKGIFDNVVNISPENTVFLDLPALTASMTMIVSLPEFQKTYVRAFEGIKPAPSCEIGKVEVPKASFDELLPLALNLTFPRSYSACENFGFEWSCGRVVRNLLGGDYFNHPSITVSNIDQMTLVFSVLEGLFDFCDSDGNDLLSLHVLDGSDELDCGFQKLKELTTRLGKARILKLEPKALRKLNRILGILNSTIITRSFAKVAMSRGTLKDPWLNPILLPVKGAASLASVYSLLGEILEDESAH